MPQRIVHLYILETYADWEAVFAISMINKKTYQPYQAHPGRYQVKTVGDSKELITTAAGLMVLPDMTVDELEPGKSAMLILPGADTWLEEARLPILEKAKPLLPQFFSLHLKVYLKNVPKTSSKGSVCFDTFCCMIGRPSSSEHEREGRYAVHYLEEWNHGAMVI